MEKDFDPGLLQDAHAVGSGYYFLVEGTAPHDGRRYGFVTRGKKKNNAATRIPIRLRLPEPGDLKDFVSAVQDSRCEGKPHFLDYMAAMKSCGYDRRNLELLYVVMPRYGNLISGLEADAPGGTESFGETRGQIAGREFDEEADLTALCVYESFPSGMQFSSGCYDEVQRIDFALVIGNPTKLVEGASRWGSVSLTGFSEWVLAQNNPDDPTGWKTDTFIPMDGKVVLATFFLDAHLRNLIG